MDASLNVEWLGQIEYVAAWERQKAAVQALTQQQTPQQLLLLEHPPTYTFGRKGNADNLIFDEATLLKEGISTHWVDRGGDVTYHGPGQLVGYPILNLHQISRTETLDVHQYLRDLEQTIINTLAQLGIVGWRYPGYTGVWVDQIATDETHSTPHKIAAIGVKVSGNGITSHGFSLNVSPNMHHFTGIIPCGISEHAVTSIEALIGRKFACEDILPIYLNAFTKQFNLSVIAPA